MKTTAPKKTSGEKPRKECGRFQRLTRSEVKWLKKDLRKARKGVKELEAQRKAPSVSANPKLRKSPQWTDEHKFISRVGVATAVTLTVKAAKNGDKWSGIFLAEMIPFLSRQKLELMKNDHFARRVSEMGSAQKPRIQGRTLRTEIEEIIREARSQRHVGDLTKDGRLLPRARKDIRALERRAKLLKKEGFDFNTNWLEDLRDRLSRVETAAKAEALQKLPEFSLSSADQWFEHVVWPELQRREPELRANPLIGELKKANKSGKFQLSDLKTQALQTVRRIAKLPRAYYFW